MSVVLLLRCTQLLHFQALHEGLHARAQLTALPRDVGAVDGEDVDAVITRHDLVCDHALIRPVGAELHLLVDRAVGFEVVHELGDVVVAVLDAVQRALARALGVLQIPAAHLRERILAVREHDLLTAGGSCRSSSGRRPPARRSSR